MNVVLDLSVPAGGRVRTTWRPASGDPRGWVWVQHGFSRRARDMAGVAQLLSEAGYVTVSPDLATLRPWRSLHDVTWLTSAAATIARAVEVGLLDGRGIPTAGPMIGVGHSAGAAVVAHAAMVMRAVHRPASAARPVSDSGSGDEPTRVAGLALLDPVDSVGAVFAQALPSLADLPIESLTCHPSRCNRNGFLADELARAGRPVVPHRHLNHADPERIPARLAPGEVPAPSRAAQFLCGPAGTAADVVAMGEGLLAAVDRCLTGD